MRTSGIRTSRDRTSGGPPVITFTGKLNLICKKKPTIFMEIPHIRCREIMYQVWGNHVITFMG